MGSLDVQEEAVHLSRSHRRSRSFLVPSGEGGSSSSGGQGASGGFQEAWDHLLSTFGHPTGFAFTLATRIFPVEHWLDARWWLLKRDAELVIAYVMTQEHIMKELEILAMFPEDVQGPMKSITEEAKKQVLFALVKKPYDGAMLALFEHVLLARLLVRMQVQLVEQLQKEGSLVEEDAHALLSRVIRPTEKALFEFTPTAAQLRKMGSSCVEGYTNQTFKRWLMRLVFKVEFHEAD